MQRYENRLKPLKCKRIISAGTRIALFLKQAMKQHIYYTFLVLGLLLGGVPDAKAQDSLRFFELAPAPHQARIKGVAITEIAGYTGTMIALNSLWYKDFPRSSFHFFNDNDEWLQIDKLGHAATAYYVGLAGMGVLRWSGVEDRKAIWYGGTLGLAFLTSVEIFDGFSSQWGASPGDLLANVGGTALLIGQEFGWGEQRIKMKFSAHLTEYAELRPAVLGSSFSERLLKDYNGQTYWLSANVASFLPTETRFPKWLNVAVGYSGDGIITGSPETILEDPSLHRDRFRQYFLSLDVDLAKIPTRSRFLKTVFQTFGFLKVPFPALEYHGNDGFKFRSIYF